MVACVCSEIDNNKVDTVSFEKFTIISHLMHIIIQELFILYINNYYMNNS